MKILLLAVIILFGCEYEYFNQIDYFNSLNYTDANIQAVIKKHTNNKNDDVYYSFTLTSIVDHVFNYDKTEFYIDDDFIGFYSNSYLTYSYTNQKNINYKIILYNDSVNVGIINGVAIIDYSIIE